jgi:thiamine-phosphate pyrophosphorylase
MKLSGLYAITPDDPLLPRLAALVRAALAGGVKWVQYRNKSASPLVRHQQATELLRLCRAAGARLIINDDVWLAVEIGADGAHIGRDDGPGASLDAARDALGQHRILGVSCYNEPARAKSAASAGADYVGVGSMFVSSTKPKAVRASPEILMEVRRVCGLPVAAIGGIKLANAQEVRAAGADMLAVMSDLFDTMNIKARAEAYQTLFKEIKETK